MTIAVRKINNSKLLLLASCVRRAGEVISDIDEAMDRTQASAVDEQLIELHNDVTAFRFKLIDAIKEEHKLSHG